LGLICPPIAKPADQYLWWKVCLEPGTWNCVGALLIAGPGSALICTSTPFMSSAFRSRLTTVPAFSGTGILGREYWDGNTGTRILGRTTEVNTYFQKLFVLPFPPHSSRPTAPIPLPPALPREPRHRRRHQELHQHQQARSRPCQHPTRKPDVMRRRDVKARATGRAGNVRSGQRILHLDASPAFRVGAIEFQAHDLATA
jgi:hypothetical protein